MALAFDAASAWCAFAPMLGARAFAFEPPWCSAVADDERGANVAAHERYKPPAPRAPDGAGFEPRTTSPRLS